MRPFYIGMIVFTLAFAADLALNRGQYSVGTGVAIGNMFRFFR